MHLMLTLRVTKQLKVPFLSFNVAIVNGSLETDDPSSRFRFLFGKIYRIAVKPAE